jgi:DGQHR domain-containing protein
MPIKPKFISIDAIPVTQAGVSFYLLSIAASTLWRITEINQRSEDKDEGYQRALSNARVRNIARYIKTGGMLPGSIVVTFDDGTFNKKTQKLRLPIRKNVGWIIDGQHRLAGAHEASKGSNSVDLKLPTIAFLELPPEKQIELFITINREARGVPASLYIDLLKNLPRQKTERELTEERIADIARGIDRDEQSPFHQKIIFTSTAKAGQISLNNFARILRPHIMRPAGTIALFTPHEQEGAINNFYKALAVSFPKVFKKSPSILFRTIGFGAVFRAFPLIFNLTRTRYNAFSVANISKILKEVNDFDFEKWVQAGTGSGAEISAGEDLIAAIEEAFAEDGGVGTLTLE